MTSDLRLDFLINYVELSKMQVDPSNEFSDSTMDHEPCIQLEVHVPGSKR